MKRKKVLIRGTGLIARPMIRYLLEINEFEIIVTSRTVKKAEDLIARHPYDKRALALDASADPEGLSKIVEMADLVMSLLPATHHKKLANTCRKHMVITSYVSPMMMDMNKKVKEADLLFLNEAGLEPGIDHMSAMKIFDDIHKNNGIITSFFNRNSLNILKL